MARSRRILKTYTVVVVHAPEGGYTAHVLALAGCASQGKTLRDVRANIREAAEGWIESALARRVSLPVDKHAGHAARRRCARVIRIRVATRAPLGRIDPRAVPTTPVPGCGFRRYDVDDD